MDERTFFAQTKQQGFYVSSGEVALMKDKYVFVHKRFILANAIAAPRNQRAGKASEPLSTAHVSLPLPWDLTTRTTRSASRAKSMVMEARSARRRKFGPSIQTLRLPSKSSRSRSPKVSSVCRILVTVLTELSESWAAKGKFPPSLKPVLGQVALKAVVLGEYDDNFFNIMPKLFPYNKFTMTVSLFSSCHLHPLIPSPETDKANNLERTYGYPHRPTD